MTRVRITEEHITCDHCNNLIDTKFGDEQIIKSYDYCEDCNNHLMKFSKECKECHKKENIGQISNTYDKTEEERYLGR